MFPMSRPYYRKEMALENFLPPPLNYEYACLRPKLAEILEKSTKPERKWEHCPTFVFTSDIPLKLDEDLPRTLLFHTRTCMFQA